CFQTIDPNNPNELTEDEQEVINKLLLSVQQSEKLKRHMTFLMQKGKLYLPYNGNLLIHGCIPVDENGEMESMGYSHGLRGYHCMEGTAYLFALRRSYDVSVFQIVVLIIIIYLSLLARLQLIH